jgi:pyruvate kinase
MVKKRSSAPSAEVGQADASQWRRMEVCHALIAELQRLRVGMLEREASMAVALSAVLPKYRDSARNLIHYLALRAHDLRPLQERLAWLGLSSLGRSESHVLANLDKVLGILHCLTGQGWHDLSEQEPAGSVSSRRLLEQHCAELLGPSPMSRAVRIMVTLPREAGEDPSLVREYLEAGMDIARINCAHDDAPAWRRMADNIRAMAAQLQRPVKILMDLGGPKLRTGEMAPRPPVLRMRPLRDDFGRPYRPYRLGIRSAAGDGAEAAEAGELAAVDGSIQVDAKWLAHLKVGTQIDFSDARGAKRHLLVVQVGAQGAVAQSLQTAYVTPQTLLTIHAQDGKKRRTTLVGTLPDLPGVLYLHRGEIVRVTKDGVGQSALVDENFQDVVLEPARIACTLPQAIDQVGIGERIWFDDGRIGGVVRNVSSEGLEVEITQARDGGEKLVGDKGINLPDSTLNLPALTAQDLQDLATVAELADMVGLSFVHSPEDVHQLRTHLLRLGRPDMGIVLKIETIKGFENLPELLLAAMAGESFGVMIARGDLAVECGYERLAEVQEEILWCTEAAHMPVIWATQVLENMAKTGVPSRAEISDAGLGVRADCVMLNKGPYVTEAIRSLDNILRRMAGHHAKKRSLLRALRAWSATEPTA